MTRQQSPSLGFTARIAFPLFCAALVPLLGLAGCGGDDGSDEGPSPSASTADVLKYVPQDAVAGVLARPKQLLTKKELENLPIEVVSAAGQQHLGIDPLHVELVLILGSKFGGPTAPGAGPSGQPDYGVVVLLDEALDIEDAVPMLRQGSTKAELDGRTYFRSQDPSGPCIFMPDDQTLLIGTDTVMKQMVAADGSNGKLAQRLAAVDTACDAAAVVDMPGLLKQMDDVRSEIPESMRDFVTAVERMDAAELTLTFGESLRVQTAFHAKDEAGAAFITAQINKALEMGRDAYQQWSGATAISDDADYAAAMKQYLDRVSEYVLGVLAPQQDGTKVAVIVDLPVDFTVLGMGAALAAMRVNYEQEMTRVEATNNMEQIREAIEKFDAQQFETPVPQPNFDRPPDSAPQAVPRGDEPPDQASQPDPPQP